MGAKKTPPNDDRPFPETGYSPALQRTLKRKFDEADAGGELDSVDREEFFRMLGKTAEPDPEGCGPSE